MQEAPIHRSRCTAGQTVGKSANSRMVHLGEESSLLDEMLLESSAASVIWIAPLRMKGLQGDGLAIQLSTKDPREAACTCD